MSRAPLGSFFMFICCMLIIIIITNMSMCCLTSIIIVISRIHTTLIQPFMISLFIIDVYRVCVIFCVDFFFIRAPLRSVGQDVSRNYVN